MDKQEIVCARRRFLWNDAMKNKEDDYLVRFLSAVSMRYLPFSIFAPIISNHYVPTIS